MNRLDWLWFDRPVKKTSLRFWVLGLRSSFCRHPVRDICRFAVLCWVTRHFCRFTSVYEGHFKLCYKEELKVEEPLNRAMANFKRS